MAGAVFTDAVLRSRAPHRAGALRTTRATLSLLALLFTFCFARAAEVIPPAPPNHFNDFANVVRPETAAELNRELAQFERDTSTQLVVAIYPRMQSASSVDDYAVRVAQQWRVGQKERKNGAVLFVFQQSHDIRIVTGYGLEGSLPDARCKQIIENEIVPRFRAGDFDGGLAAGTRAMMAAVRGEYRGTGRTAAESSGRGSELPGGIVFLIIAAIVVVSAIRQARRNVVYGRGGRRSLWMGNGPWGGWGGGGGFGGGSSSGGTFSGGGGSFGGGGAGGKW